MYRICKQFEFQAAHVLSKHSGKCRYPHGHSYKVEITLSAEQLDDSEMVCDFHAITALVKEALEGFDHSILLNSADAASCESQKDNPRRIVFDNQDPTSEVLAQILFRHITEKLREGRISVNGVAYTINPHARIEKVRVWETTNAWAEYTDPDPKQ